MCDRLRRIRAAFLSCAVLLILSCSGDNLLLDEAPDDPEFDGIRARLALTIAPGPEGQTGNSACNTTECTSVSFSGQLYFECQATRGAQRVTTGCGAYVREAEARICVADTLLAIIESPRFQVLRIRPGLQGESVPITIGPQDAESNAELAGIALAYAGGALQSAGRALADAGVCSAGSGAGQLGGPAGTGAFASTTLAEELAQFFVEALDLARQAGDHAAEAGSAVSDAAYGRRTDSASASRDTLAPFASRTSAAHALVGGAYGLPALRGVSENGFFTRSRLTAEGQRALQLMRITAVSPDLVTGSVPIDDLVAGTGTVAAKDSIRFRLAKMRQDAVLLAATTASSVYESLGVSREGFSEARELLREEIRAFDRSPTEPLPAERLPDGSMTSAHEITLYAATRNPPEQLPASYWSALLRYDPTPQTIDLGWEPAWAWLPDSAGNVPPGYTYGSETSASTDPPLVSGTRTLASVLDEVVARGPTAVARLCPTGTCGTQALGRAREAIVGALAAFAANPTTQAGSFPSSLYETADYVGRARVCWLHSTYWDDALIRLTGVVPSDVRVVVGRDGLECAVRGTIDGTPCTSATLSALTPNTVPNTPDSFWVYDLQQRVSDRPNSGLVSLFLVRKRPSTEAAPGNYEELTGWVLPAITSGNLGYRYCQGAVIAPGLDRQAAALIQPRTEPPYRPAESCAGLPSDMRIPLENELTDDGNGIESSWQHYLRLAQTAANEADLLGEDLVRTGMEMDARAEAASDELSRLCGVSINLTSIASAIAADTSPASMPAMGGACASPYVLRGDQCVRDPILYALQRANAGDDYARLASCVGTDTVAWASLGNTPVCAWDANGSAPGGLCDGATPDMPCPIASSTGTNCGSMARPAGATPVNVPDFVGIFARPAEPEPDPPNPNDLPCAALSRARHASGSLTLEEFARLHQFLTHDNISDLAQQVTWEALVGDYSTVSFANATVFRTGSMSQPPSITSLWPMGPAPTLQTATGNVSACPTGAASASDPLNYTGPLFCLQNVASVTGNDGRLARARMNDLLARAVLAVRIFSGNGLGQTILPYYNDNWASCYYAAPSTFSWRRLGTSNGWCSSTGDFLVDHSTSDTAGANTRAVPDYGSRSCFVGTSDSAIPTACPSTFPGIPSGQGTACIVGGLPSIPAEAEWSLCPYDSPSCAEIFDEAFDCDDGTGLPAGQWPNWDHNLPLVLRPADAGLTRENGYVAAAALWDRRGPLRNLVLRSRQRTPEELLAPLESVDSDIRVDDLTNYYQSWQDRGFGAYVRHPEGDYIAATEDPALRLLAEGNRAFIGRNGLTYSDLLNGLELACVASRFALPPEFPQCQAPGPTQSLTDVFRTEDYLRCQANVISQRGSDTMISGLPKRVVDALRDSTAGSGGAGEFDAQVAEIRAGLMELSTTRETLATDLRSFSARIRSLRSVVAVNERSREIEELMVASRTAERLTQCVTALATIASTFDPAGSAGKAAAAVATCANSYTQNVIDSHVQRLREANLDEELIQQFATFDGDLASYSGAFTQRSIELRAAIERINAALARLRSTQNQARRALARALLLESDGAGAHFRLDTTYRARYSTQLTRYRNAHRRAVRSAYIARIALEQRLGMPLADIEDDLYADEAPREWVDEICTLPSIDYDTLGQEIGEGAVPADYSGTYVGDYVRRLENVFESYSFVHPFREGTDTAVISLRDDVFRTRAPCESETPSLLYHGGSFATLAGEGRPGWQLLGCNATLVTGQLNRSCVDATALEATTGMGMDQLPEMPTSVVGADFGRPAPYRLTFGETAAATAGARLEQSLELPRGRYRVSWWARRGPSNTIQPSAAVVLWSSSGASVQVGGVWPSTLPLATNWGRYWAFADHAGGTLRVVIPYGGTGVRDIDIAGVMLEDVSGVVVGSLSAMESIPNPGGSPTMVVRGDRASPPPFFEGGETGLRTLRTCRDDYGIYFQREAWEQGCVRVCRDGYDGSCAPGDATETRCYRQSSFDISSDSLQQMLLRGDAGFAAGNFNYRIESVAVNLVGTGLRDCGGRGDTSGCYANGNFSFSMLHMGPYVVRNALGSLYEAPLFPGRLESARSVAAERYITNPISSADQALIGPYTRGELQGRPLGGALVLRLWDDPAFRFDRLEDVQIVLTYRYWQHQR